jgi:hypothetical protein
LYIIVWLSAHSHAVWSFAASSFLLNGRTLTVTNIFSSFDLELPPGVMVDLELPPGVRVDLELPPGVRVSARSIFDIGVPGGLDATMSSILIGVHRPSIRTAASRLRKTTRIQP